MTPPLVMQSQRTEAISGGVKYLFTLRSGLAHGFFFLQACGAQLSSPGGVM